jgi:hypothetical protein
MFVTKKDTPELRFVVDYRDLNRITVKNRYPTPLFDSFISRLANAKYFVKFDLR